MAGLRWWLLFGAASACAPAPREAPAAASSTPRAITSASPAPTDEAERCSRAVERLRRLPALPGAPDLEAARAQILGRAKAAPLLFTRAPAQDDGPSAEARVYRTQLETNRAPLWQLHLLSKYIVNRPEIARALFLREGYLYAETPALAGAITEWVELGHLHKEPELVIERGTERRRVVRGKLGYEWADGSARGQRARLWLWDRVYPAGSTPAPAVTLDLRPLVAKYGFDELRVERLTSEGVVAELVFGEERALAALSGPPGALDQACFVAVGDARERLMAAVDLGQRRRAVAERLRATIDLKVAEGLPFDEPRTEDGQQDGELRRAWLWAYRHGWDSYTFNDDGYRVFDTQGRPYIPEVCIDFVTDVLERASGTWYRPRHEERARTQGGLDFDLLGIENRRSVENFVDFAWAHPEWFEVVDLEPDERVPLIAGERFFAVLYEHRARYRPGDIVTLHGLRSDGKVHYHSFFVVDADPVTGMPTQVASNAGVPRVRTWEQELRPAPLRSIRSRVRPRLEWMEATLRSGAPLNVSRNESDAGGTEPI